MGERLEKNVSVRLAMPLSVADGPGLRCHETRCLCVVKEGPYTTPPKPNPKTLTTFLSKSLSVGHGNPNLSSGQN